ncbi:BolA family protein [uncultured Jannaschia sp.]|uniref:BolA family protein n=1 Tax=uncultured Jannaschia sp. TaxID=293347 RepID=UPI00262EACFF|nr:BolA family protein [uncultured Jannaschia sp.]
MRMQSIIEARLNDAFAPERLAVSNESAKHSGHAGDDGSGESHWHVAMAAGAFAGKSRLTRHRMVHAALGDVMTRIHALSLDLDDVS